MTAAKPHFIFSIFILFCLPGKAAAQLPEHVYGRKMHEIYREKGVKEVQVTKEQFYDGKPSVPLYLEQRLLVDKNGRVTRRETAGGSNYEISYRHDQEYDEKGRLLVSTSYSRETGPDGSYLQKKNTPVTALTWVPSTRHRYQKAGKEQPGSYNWGPQTGQWALTEKNRTYQKGDTVFIETTKLSYPGKEVSRSFPVAGNKDLVRTDYLSYSPKGLGEPKYYYRKTENGRLVESGEVDFEVELYLHMEKFPESRRLLFGAKSNFNHLHDHVARRNPGTLKPTSTYTYSPEGFLVAETSYDTRKTYQRDQTGRLLTHKEQHGGSSGRLVTYYYNQNGLVEKALSQYLDGKPEENRFYQYSFY